MTARRPLPERFTELPFTARAAQDAGVPAGRLAASDLTSPFHGVRQSASLPRSLEWSCQAYLERMGAHHVFSNQTATRLYGLPLPLRFIGDPTLHITAPGRAPIGRGITGHWLDPAHFSARDLIYQDAENGEVFAFPVVTPPLVWAQMSGVLGVADLVALGDAIVGAAILGGTILGGASADGATPLAGIRELGDVSRAWRGRRGAKAMAAALPLIRTGSRSRTESVHRLLLCAAGIPEPELNVTVTDREGNDIAAADFSWPEYRVVVEYEGDVHRRSVRRFRSDITRGERYADGDWFQLRAHADDVFGDPNPFAARLARRLRARGWVQPRELRQITGAAF